MIIRFPFALAAAILATGAIAAVRTVPTARPNIIFILADDMGIGDVSYLNPRSIWRTPNLDRLAREGMIFTDAHSSSGVCTPTRYTLLTGRYSWRGQRAPAVRRDFLVHHSAEGEFAIRQGNWKLILAPGSGGWSPPSRSPSPWTQAKADNFDGLPPFQLYDLATDPAERINLAAAHPEIVQRLGRLMRATIERGRSTPGTPQRNADGPWPQVGWMGKFSSN